MNFYFFKSYFFEISISLLKPSISFLISFSNNSLIVFSFNETFDIFDEEETGSCPK